MENLNDVEFGSDKSTEEAPILIAQRYLNIYRQIHVFNKEKRDQFDDELLALPKNVTDFFKRMPGGRLLVEHIEEVKTERGIAFVKSNKEDFTNGADANNATSNTPSTAPISQAVSGATVAIDASFAQTLAQSMANAFKQIPTMGTSNGGITPSSADFGKAFELIAEEIKTSRSSLLDVLQEMHVMTSSLIASQVSIARTLENILSNPVAVQSASQQEYKQFYEKPRTVARNELPFKAQTTQITDRNKSDKNESPIIKEKTISTITQQQPVKQNVEQVNTAIATASLTSVANSTDEKQRKKKKKKKNKENRGLENGSVSAVDNEQKFQINTHDELAASKELATSLIAKSGKIAPALGNIVRETIAKHGDMIEDHNDVQQIVRESINLDEPLLDTEISDFNDNALSMQSGEEKVDNSTFNLDDLSALIDEKPLFEQPAHETFSQEENNNFSDYSLPEQEASLNNTSSLQATNENLDNIFSEDGLDFVLPEQGCAVEETPTKQTTHESLDNIFDSDGLDFALPEQGIDVDDTVHEQESKKSIEHNFSDDDLDFALPEQSVSAEANFIPRKASENLNNIFSDDDLDFALPEQNIAIKETPTPQDTNKNLDNIFSGDSLDFALPENDITDETINQQKEDTSLDGIFGGNDEVKISPLDTISTTTEENVATNDFSALDDIFAENNNEAPHQIRTMSKKNNSEPERTSSRYSEELDRIRAALTSDNVDISSLDQPIELDDYSDDEGILNKENEDDYIPIQPSSQQTVEQEPDASTVSDDEDWEWEYVDENGNPISAPDDGEWEWEYVEDDSEGTPDNNNK